LAALEKPDRASRQKAYVYPITRAAVKAHYFEFRERSQFCVVVRNKNHQAKRQSLAVGMFC